MLVLYQCFIRCKDFRWWTQHYDPHTNERQGSVTQSCKQEAAALQGHTDNAPETSVDWCDRGGTRWTWRYVSRDQLKCIEKKEWKTLDRRAKTCRTLYTYCGNCWFSCVQLLPPHALYPARLLRLWDSPEKNTGEGCHFLLQGIILTQKLNPGLLHCRQILYGLSYEESPYMEIPGDERNRWNDWNNGGW